MQCNRKTAVLASFAFGVLTAGIVLDGAAPETPLAGQSARGLGVMLNGIAGILGPTGAAVACLLAGGLMAIVSALICPSGRTRS